MDGLDSWADLDCVSEAELDDDPLCDCSGVPVGDPDASWLGLGVAACVKLCEVEPTCVAEGVNAPLGDCVPVTVGVWLAVRDPEGVRPWVRVCVWVADRVALTDRVGSCEGVTERVTELDPDVL